MTRWLLIVTFDNQAGSRARTNWATEAGRLFACHPGIVTSQTGTHLPGRYGTGHLTCDLTTAEDLAAREAIEELMDAIPGVVASHVVIGLRPVGGHARPQHGTGIKRNLLLQVRSAASPDQVARLESSLMAMPSHISGIQSWALSRVCPPEEGRPWTHVWEQEFPDVTAFETEYMRHPYHWTGVDRWFDHEVPGAIVEPEFANVLYEIAGPVLTGQPAVDVTAATPRAG